MVVSSSRAWGLHVEAIKLEDIDVPEELKKMMSRQASSEREKRATIIKADGDRQAAAALAEAASTMAAAPGAMQLRVLQTLDGLGPSASNTVVLAVPLEVIESMRTYIGSHKNWFGFFVAPPDACSADARDARHALGLRVRRPPLGVAPRRRGGSPSPSPSPSVRLR